MGFEIVKKFERSIASFFGAPYAVAVDSCTHGIELSLRYMKVNKIKVPASYLNFYIANKIVLLPIFKDKNDKTIIVLVKRRYAHPFFGKVITSSKKY